MSEYAGKEDKHPVVVAKQRVLSLLETILAKEAKNRNILQWKTPRLSVTGRQGITVRTKWQSGIRLGNNRTNGVNGNGLCGNGRFLSVKYNPT